MPGAVRREVMPGKGESPFAGEIGRRRAVAWSSAPLADYKAIEHAAGEHTTVNDVLLAVVAGGVRSWLGHVAGDQPLRCKVPVSLHRRDDGAEVGNRDSFMIVGLPVASATRRRGCARSTARRPSASATTTPRRWTRCSRTWRCSRRRSSACSHA